MTRFFDEIEFTYWLIALANVWLLAGTAMCLSRRASQTAAIALLLASLWPLGVGFAGELLCGIRTIEFVASLDAPTPRDLGAGSSAVWTGRLLGLGTTAFWGAIAVWLLVRAPRDGPPPPLPA